MKSEADIPEPPKEPQDPSPPDPPQKFDKLSIQSKLNMAKARKAKVNYKEKALEYEAFLRSSEGRGSETLEPKPKPKPKTSKGSKTPRALKGLAEDPPELEEDSSSSSEDEINIPTNILMYNTYEFIKI